MVIGAPRTSRRKTLARWPAHNQSCSGKLQILCDAHLVYVIHEVSAVTSHRRFPIVKGRNCLKAGAHKSEGHPPDTAKEVNKSRLLFHAARILLAIFRFNSDAV